MWALLNFAILRLTQESQVVSPCIGSAPRLAERHHLGCRLPSRHHARKRSRAQPLPPGLGVSRYFVRLGFSGYALGSVGSRGIRRKCELCISAYGRFRCRVGRARKRRVDLAQHYGHLRQSPDDFLDKAIREIAILGNLSV